MEKEGKVLYGIGLDNNQLRADAAYSKNIMRGIGDATVAESARIDNSFRKIGATAAAYFTFQQTSAMTRDIVAVRAEIESLEVSFRTLVGNDEKADALFGMIRRYAVETPMMLSPLAQGAKTMLGFNIEVERIMPLLQQIGDISAADAGKFASLTLAFSQMSATGRLMGQDLLQMINAGFNPLMEIAAKTGKTIGELKKEMEGGLITTDMVSEAFASATSEGGRFFGMMDQQSKAIRGQLSNLEGAIEDAKNEIGEGNQEIITGAISMATSAVKNYERIGEILLEIAAVYGTYKAAVIATSIAENIRYQATLAHMAGLTKQAALMEVVRARALALNKALLANPYAAAAAAVIALALAIRELSKRQNDLAKAKEEINEATETAIKNFDTERAKIDMMFARLKVATEGTKEYEEAKQAIIDQYGAYLRGMGEEVEGLKNIEKAYQAVALAAENAARARAYSDLQQQAATDLVKKESDAKKEIQKTLEGRIGNNIEAKEIFLKLKPVIEGKGEITAEIEEILKGFDKKSGYTSQGTGDWIEVVRNPIRKQLDELASFRNGYMETIQETAALFAPIEGDEVAKGIDLQTANLSQLTVEAEKANKELLKLKSAETVDAAAIAEKEKAIELIKETTLARERELFIIRDVKARIDELRKEQEGFAKTDAEYQDRENRIKLLETRLPDKEKSSGAQENEAARLRREQAQAEQQIAQYEAAMRTRIEQTELELSQARIDAKKEGVEKDMEQNELNYKRLLFENQRRESEYLEALRNTKKLEWEKNNPKAEEKGETFDRSIITAADLPAEIKNQLIEYYRIAEEYRVREAESALEKMLANYATYEQQREQIAAKHKAARAELYEADGVTFRKGAGQGNIDEINRSETEAMEAVDRQFAQREEAFNAWMGHLANLSLKKLEETLATAEAELAKLEKSGTGDSKTIATARAKVAVAREKVGKANAENDAAPGERAIKDWQDLYRTLGDVRESFEGIGEAVGGTAGEIIETAGTMAASTMALISGIVSLANFSITAMKMTAEGASKAMIAAEKASLILTIISTALQVVTAMFSLFKQTDVMAAFRAEMRKLNYEIELAQLNAKIGSKDSDSIFGDDPWRRTITNIEAARTALDKFTKTTDDTKNRQNLTGWQAMAADFLGIKHSFDSAGESIENMQLKIQHKTLFRGAKYQSLGEAVPELFNDDGSLKMEALDAFIADGAFDKLSEENQQYLQQMADYWKAYQDAVEEVKNYLSDIFGDLGSTMTDAMVDAFRNGTDAAKGYIDSLGEMLEKLAKQMVYSVSIAPIMKKAEAEMMAVMEQEGDEEKKFAQFAAIIAGATEDIIAQQEQSEKLLQYAQDVAKKQGVDIFKPEQKQAEATSRGFQAMSQELGSELNGRFTGIQIDMAKVREETGAMRELMAETRAIIIQILNYVANIEKHTKQLYQMNDRLGAIERNTAKL